VSTFTKNMRTKAALGIAFIDFLYYRDGSTHWKVTLEDDTKFNVCAPNFATESTVLRLAAAKLAESGRGVRYPKGVA
jgi:hypothetical protein